MSGTLKTRRALLRAFDPNDHSVSLVAQHRHEGGATCTLGTPTAEADLLRVMGDNGYYQRRGCFYGWTANKNICGCSLCTDSLDRRVQRRRSRHRAKNQLNALAREGTHPNADSL